MKISVAILMSLFFVSCESEKEKEKNDLNSILVYNKKTKKISIDFNKLKSVDVNSIEIIEGNNNKQLLVIDSLGQIEQIYNSIMLDKNKFYINSWYTFDKQLNLIDNQSYYFDTYLLNHKTNDSSYIVYKSLFEYNGGDQYAVVGEYDKYFNLKNKFKVDTFQLDQKYSTIKIPIDNKK